MASMVTLFLLSNREARAHSAKKFSWLRCLGDSTAEESFGDQRRGAVENLGRLRRGTLKSSGELRRGTVDSLGELRRGTEESLGELPSVSSGSHSWKKQKSGNLKSVFIIEKDLFEKRKKISRIQ